MTPTDPTTAGKTPTPLTGAEIDNVLDSLEALCESGRSSSDVRKTCGEAGLVIYHLRSQLAAKDAELLTLRAERESFHHDYRMKCDVETKALHTELATLRQQLDDANDAFVGTNAACDHLRAKLTASEQANAALRAEVERLTKECVAYRNGSSGFTSSPSLHTTTSDVPESFKRGMEEIENGEVTPMFRQSAIDDLNAVAEALSGEPEIARLKDDLTAARALNDTLAGALDKAKSGLSRGRAYLPSHGTFAEEIINSYEAVQELVSAALSAYAKSKEAAK